MRLADSTLIPAVLGTLSGRRVLLAGASGSEKSALSLELLARGAAVHGDHFVLVTGGCLIPIPRRLGPRQETLAADARRGIRHRFIDPADFGQQGVPDPSRTAAIVWLERGDGSGMRPLPRIEMVKNLLSIVAEPHSDPGRKIAELNSLVAASDSLLIRGGSPCETAAALIEFFSTNQRVLPSLPLTQSGDSPNVVLDSPDAAAPITIITGSGRCGTSFAAQAFFAAGIDPGGAFGQNVRAGWEYAPVVAINQELERKALFPEEGESRRLATEYGERLRAAVAGKRIVKDPRFTHLLAVWAEAGLVGRVIHLVRPASEVISSARAAFPGGHPRRTLEEIDRRTRYLSAVCERYAIPRVFLRFPEVALDEGPDFQRLAAEIERLGVSRDRAVESIRRTRNPDLVRHSPPRPATPTPHSATISLASPSAQSVSVSIIIPVFNGLRHTRECLAALREHTVGDHEVIVVDNGSRDGTPEFLRTIAGLTILRNEENLGFARACNAGARRARGKYLLFLNNDAVPLPGWLAPLLETAERREKAGVVGALLLYPGDRTVQHAGVCMNKSGLPYHIFRHHAGDATEVVCDREMPAVTGACLLTPRSLFLECGGFDEGYVNGLEDIDYCLRVRKRGERVYYTGASVLLHHESVSEGRLDDKTQQANVRRFSSIWGDKIRPDDPADYIPEGAVNTPFQRYDAGSARLRHGTGAIEDAHLVCRPGEHAEGHAVYGPGLFVMGPQNLRVTFHLQVGGDPPPHQRIASLDIYDRREEKILCHRAVTPSQVRESAEGVVLTTPVARGQELEFRVYWHGQGALAFSHLSVAISGSTGVARAGRPARHVLSLCAIAKDETPFLREWVEFHRIVGVEHFFIFDNDSRTPIAATLADSIAQGVVTVREISGQGRQLAAYNDCLREFGNTSQWIGFLDLDEFLMPRASGGLRPLLQEYAGFGGLGVNWMMFGPSGHRVRPTGLQIEHYTCRMPDDWVPNKHIKCVVRPETVLRFDNPHFAIFREGDFCVGEHFDRIEGPFRPPSVDRIRINHYFTRSEQDFREKIGRGNACEGGKAKSFDSFKLFQAQATVRDLTTLRYVPALNKTIR